MLWRKALRESNNGPSSLNIMDLVNVNDRVQLEVYGRSYLSRIEDICGENLYIGCPIDRGRVVNIRPGIKIKLNLFLGEGLKQFETTAQEIVPDRVPLLVVSNAKYKGQVQRRDFVRVRDKLQVRYRLEGTVGNMAVWSSGVTRDVSGGGLHIAIEADKNISVGDFLEIELLIPNEKSVRAIARVVRVASAIGPTKGIGVLFVQIHPVEQRRIVLYVSRKQVEQVKPSRGFYNGSEGQMGRAS